MGSFRDLTTPKAMRVLFLVGLALAAGCGYQWFHEQQLLARAVFVPAVVLSSEVEDLSSGTGANRSREYRPVIRFRFELDGVQHESDHGTALHQGGSAPWARDLVARFPVGSKVDAWVNPDAPASAFLVRMTSWKPRAGVGVGLLIVLATGTGLWRARRRAVDPASRR